MESINSKNNYSKNKTFRQKYGLEKRHIRLVHCFLKKQFHDVLGPGSYFRFKAMIQILEMNILLSLDQLKYINQRLNFFAGVRKLPADFSAGGLYFHDLKEAMEYAVDTWGFRRQVKWITMIHLI